MLRSPILQVARSSSFLVRNLSTTKVIANGSVLLESHGVVRYDNGNGNISRFHGVWLRDNCPCTLCRHPQTGQRCTSPAHSSVAPKTVDRITSPQGGRVKVVWHDAHESIYDPTWLNIHSYWSEGPPPASSAQTLTSTSTSTLLLDTWKNDVARDVRGRVVWRGSDIPSSAPPHVPHDAFMNHDSDGLVRALRALRDFGLVIVRGCAPTETATEAVIRRIGFIRPTLYGEGMWKTEMRSGAAVVDTAFTAAPLALHTDGNYFADTAPGLQIFHCTVADESGGGDSLLLDGLAAAAEVKVRDPSAFKLLSSWPIQFHHSGVDGLVTAARPVFELDAEEEGEEILSVGWNDDDRLPVTLPLGRRQEDILAFYRALDTLRSVLTDSNMVLRFALRPGDVLIFDNTRILHGRDGFQVKSGRTLVGAYMGRDEWQSKLRQEEYRLRQSKII
jgi:trimethyllysine dioxygenase